MSFLTRRRPAGWLGSISHGKEWAIAAAKSPSAEAFATESERRVRLGLLVSELVKVENLKAKPDQIRARIEDFAQSYEKPEEVVRYYLTDKSRLAEIEAIVLEDNVVQHVLSKAQVKDEQVSFDELMGTA